MKEASKEDIHIALKDVDKENFILITKTWYHMILESYEDPKANLAMGMVEKYIPDFLDWLGKAKDFQKVQDVTLKDFINTMRLIGRLREASLKQLIERLGGHEGSS